MTAPRPRHIVADYAVAVYGVFFAAMVWIAREDLGAGRGLLLRVAGVLIAYFGGLRFLMARNSGPMRIGAFRGAALIMMVPYFFLSLGRIPEIVNPRSYEAELQAIDRAVFGVDPVLWMEQFIHPVAVDWFQIAYMSYYPLFLLGLVFLFSREHHRYNIYLGAVAVTVFVAFMTYFLVPARSPYFAARMPEFADLFPFTVPLRGSAIGQWIAHALDSTESVKVDCFPSGHTAGAVLVLLTLWNWRRRLFWFVLPLAASLIFATVYLRYHYVIDLVVGALLAAAALRTVIFVEDRLAAANQDATATRQRPGRQEAR
jgi:membrane-associated phospholipid phosphatase